MDKAPDAFRTISEVADDLDVPQHVLRFWESRFPQIRPMKRGGGRRYYRPDDVDLLRGIRHLLYGEGYTIRGVQRILREQGGRFVQSVWHDGAPQPLPEAADEAAGPDQAETGEHDLHADMPERGAPATVVVEREPAAPKAAAPAAARPPEPVRPAIAREDLQRLRKTMDGLIDCRRMLDAAIAEGA